MSASRVVTLVLCACEALQQAAAKLGLFLVSYTTLAINFCSCIYAGRGPGGLVCSNRCIRNVSAGTHNMQAVDDTSEAVDVDGGLRATADEEKKYRP